MTPASPPLFSDLIAEPCSRRTFLTRISTRSLALPGVRTGFLVVEP